MKKLIFITLMSSVSIVKAQFTQGDKYLGGNVGLGFTTSTFNQNSSILTGSGNSFRVSFSPTFFKAVKCNCIESTLEIPDSLFTILTTKIAELVLEPDDFAKRPNPNPIASTTGMSDTIITSLISKLYTLILQADDLASRAGSENPLLINYKNQIKVIKDGIKDRIQELRKEYGYGVNSKIDSVMANIHIQTIRKVLSINSNILHGFTAGLGFATSNNSSQNQGSNYLKNVSNNFNVSIGYAIRKYKPLSEKLFWYMEYNANIGYSYGWMKAVTTSTNNTTKTDAMGYNISIGVLPALAFKVDNRLLLDVNFGGLSTGYYYSSSEGYHAHNYFVNLNLTSRFTLGILWKLKKSSRS